MPVIECRELSKSFSPTIGKKRVDALKPLTMSVNEHEVFGFLGPNGAGKTTTIKILTGLIHATSGEARMFGEPVGDAKTRARLGYLPEHPYFYDHLTGAEILDYVGRLFGLSAADRRTRSKRLLERVGLAHAADQRLRGYSKGMLQRIGIAQALINDPPLLILDEPMSGLDPIGRKEVRDLILELRAEKKTIFFSTHILTDVEVVCDRIAILDTGNLVTLGPLSELLQLAGSDVEVVLADLPAAGKDALAQIPGSTFRETGTRTVVRLPQEQAFALLDLSRRHGATLLALTPVRRSLEEIFMARISPENRREGA